MVDTSYVIVIAEPDEYTNLKGCEFSKTSGLYRYKLRH